LYLMDTFRLPAEGHSPSAHLILRDVISYTR
jgi:hypothetical protein